MRTLLLLFLTLVVCGPAFAQGDAATGKAIFEEQCASCHPVGPKSTLAGPTLRNVVWRRIAGLRDFAYTRALRSSVGDWSPARLDAYLKNTEAFAAGTSMFYEVQDPGQRKLLINYLKTLK